MRATAALLLLCASTCKPSPGPASSAAAGDTASAPSDAAPDASASATAHVPPDQPARGIGTDNAAAAATSAPRAAALPPLMSEHPLVPLEVAGFRPAMVALPVGATE